MSDKEQQIEEIEKFIYDYVDSKQTERVYLCRSRVNALANPFVHNKALASALYNAGYRKVPVNAAGGAEEAQCKDLQRIIEEERELQGNIGDDVMDMLIASAIYAEGYRKVPIGSVIVPIEERETIEKRVEELQKSGSDLENEVNELLTKAKVFFDSGVRSKVEYVAFRKLLDVCDFAIHAKERINKAVKDFSLSLPKCADEIRVRIEDGETVYKIRKSKIREYVKEWLKENE